jgi:hypothetical protein
MTSAESSVEVGLPPDQTHRKWLEWTGEGGPGTGGSRSTEVTAEKLPSGLSSAEKGNCYFDAADGGKTRVRMQLRYNQGVIEKEGLAPDWVDQRIKLYLSRFKNFAEGRRA